MRLQKTVNSPTQLRPSRRKQGRDGANNKAGAQISTAPPTTAATTCHPPFLLLRPPPPPPPWSSSSLLPLPPLRTPSLPPSPLPPRQSTACCLGNNTKRFFSTAPSPRQHLAFLQAVVRSARPASSHSGLDARRIGRNQLGRCRQVWTDAGPECRSQRRWFSALRPSGPTGVCFLWWCHFSSLCNNKLTLPLRS